MGLSEAGNTRELQQSHLNSSQQTPEELQEEQRKIRRLQIMMNMVMSVISQDATLTVDEASEMVADTRRAALTMFPDKELAWDLIYKPRLQRLMRERYRIQ
jgi:shikimate 5-dehydrogenase